MARFVLLPAFLYEGIRFLERRISQFSSQNAGNLTCYLAQRLSLDFEEGLGLCVESERVKLRRQSEK